MFGYVLAGKLNKEDEKIYRAFYCGECKELKKFGNLSRITLNFDTVFLAIFLSSYFSSNDEIKEGKCALHPVKKCFFARSEAIEYAAKMNILLAYYKFDDDVRDDKSAGAMIARRIISSAAEKVKKEFPQKAETIKSATEELAMLEKRGVHDFSLCADKSGKILACVFDKNGNDELLSSFGHSLGRAIYVLDACCDLKKDIKRQKFNPMVEISSKDFQQILTIMLSETTSIYDTMNMKKYSSIIENVLFSGIWERYEAKEKK